MAVKRDSHFALAGRKFLSHKKTFDGEKTSNGVSNASGKIKFPVELFSVKKKNPSHKEAVRNPEILQSFPWKNGQLVIFHC